MADGEVKINTKLDTSGLDKGLKELKGKIDSAGKTIDAGSKKNNALATSLKTITSGAIGTAAGIAGVTVAVKKTVEALNECSAAYRVQQTAEMSLQNAAKNNPYLNEESVYRLKNYASELQNMSEIGDEVSLQVMSQLAAAGRNEEQIKQIMSAAIDMAATTGNSLQNVAMQLNKTYSGLAGELGESNGAIKALTKEELENGKAIEIVAAQYKGAAAATAQVEVQLSNAWGDFKENIGQGWQNVTQPVKQFFLDVLKDINEATSKTKNLKNAPAENVNGEEITNTITTAKEAKAAFKALEKNIKDSSFNFEDWANTKTKSDIKQILDYTYKINGITVDQLALQKQLQNIVNNRGAAEREAAEAATKEAEAAAKIAAAANETEDINKKAADYIKENTKALQEQVKAKELQSKVTGEEINAGELYNLYLNSYIDLITKSNGLVTENNTAAKERLAIIKELAIEVKNAADAEERLILQEKLEKETAELLEEIRKGENLSYIEEYENKQTHLAALKDIINANEILSEQEKNEQLLKLDEQYAQNKKDIWQAITEEINSNIQQTADIAQQAGELMLENVQSESDLEIAKLNEKYDKGEVSEEEYYNKLKQIRRKAAQDEYKIKMFEWTASMLAATANIAEGVSKAIAQGGTAGIITGALVAAAGGVQLGSIIAAKPIPPNFYAGGIIGGANGATMGGDNTYIHARSGEMVLNAIQQRDLWDKLNGQTGKPAAGLNLTVNNTQSGVVTTDIQQTNDGLIIDILDKHINHGFSDGSYDAGLAEMNTRQEGVRIL